jgi:hypothetical protein
MNCDIFAEPRYIALKTRKAKCLAVYSGSPRSGVLTNYHIIEAQDGSLYCSCWAWKRQRTCKHLEHYICHKDLPENSGDILARTVEAEIRKLGEL